MLRPNLSPAVLLLGLVCAVSACDIEGLTETNENPNAPTEVPAGYVLASVIIDPVWWAFGSTGFWSGTAIWPQHFVEIQYPYSEVMAIGGRGNEWTFYYYDLTSVQWIIQQGADPDNPNAHIEAVGRIWKSWIFHIITDRWGDVPYSEALQGADNPTPVYDPQSAIYSQMLADLTNAVGLLDAGGAEVGSDFVEGDLIYGGDFAAWRRFANSLRMRLAMRLSEVDPATAQSEFVAAYNSGGFESSADDAWLQWPGPPYENPLYQNYLQRDDHGVSATMIDTLKSLNDPRLELYAEPAAEDGEYRGHQNGRADLPGGLYRYSRIGNFWRADGAVTPTAIMTYSEVLFLEAEAAARGWIAADPAALYAEAIAENMTLYDAPNSPTSAEITAYLAQPAVAYNPATGLTQIYLQKWIGLWMNGSEVWAEWRRTGVPDLAMGPDLVLPRIPIRFAYPESEQSLNGANLMEAVSRQGGGLDFITPVWWDVN